MRRLTIACYIGWGMLLTLSSCSKRSASVQQNHLDYLNTDTTISYQELTQGFMDPPDQSRLRSLWKWPHSLVTKESITRDLEEFRKKGWGGVLINDGGNSSSKFIRSEEHTSELQSRENLVCRLL